MKKKILIIIVAIVVAFFLGFFIRDIVLEKRFNDTHTVTFGTVESINEDKITVVITDDLYKSEHEKINFSLNDETKNLSIGDSLKLVFKKTNINEKGFVTDFTYEILGKARLFANLSGVPVSNSTVFSSLNSYVYKSFNLSDSFNPDNNFKKANEFYYKKIVSYEEYLKYKNLIPEIRELTQDDFIHYYLVIAFTEDAKAIYMHESSHMENNVLTLELHRNQALSTDSSIKYSGLSIVVPNSNDVEESSLKLVILDN